MNSILLNISNSLEDPKLKSTCLSLAKEFKPTVQAELWRVHELAMTFYFQSKDKELLKLCGLFEDVSFNGNFNTWTPIEHTLLLKCRILDKANNTKELDKVLTRLKTVDSFEWEKALTTQINRNVRKRRIEDKTLLKNEAIELAFENQNRNEELEARKIHYSELLFIYFFSENQDKSLLLEIQENETIIKELNDR